MNTYKLDDLQVQEYEGSLTVMKAKNNELKCQKISSELFRTVLKKNFKEHSERVARVFNPQQYERWNACLKELERYQVLSEEKLVSWGQILALYELEDQYDKERKKMWESVIDESQKHQFRSERLDNLYSKIYNLLGQEVAIWYIYEKKLFLRALKNMDKCGATYNEGY